MMDLGADLLAAVDAIRGGVSVAAAVDIATLDIDFDIRGAVPLAELEAIRREEEDAAAAEKSRKLARGARLARSQKASQKKASRREVRAKAGVSEWFGRVEYHGVTDAGNPSDKFWECRVIKKKGKYLAQVRFGKIGVWGQTRVVGEYSFRSIETCKWELEKRQRSKLRKGYGHG